LISTVEDWARQQGIRDVVLRGHPSAGEQRFYRSMGYEATGCRFYNDL
jgi:GNAT superfamily N-acetyltransferase